MPEKITIVKDGGEQVNSNIVSVFLIPDMNKKYIITTENAVDPHGLTVLHVSEIQGDTLVKVATDEEWATIKTIMRAIISGSVGNYQYIPSFETINAAGAYSRDISVSAPASKQMIDGYASGEKIEPVEEVAEEETIDTANVDSIFPTAPVDTEENEVVPGIAMDDPVTIENTPEQPEVDPSVQGAMPLDPATLPVQEPVPQAPAQVAPAPQAPTPVIQQAVPTPVIQEPQAPAPAPAAAPAPESVPTPVAPAPVAPVATPVPEQPVAPAPQAEAPVPGAELVPQANPAVNPTTVVPEVMEQPIPTPDSIVQDVAVVEPAPEAVLDKVDEVTAAVNNVANEATTPNGAAVAVPADPNAVEVNAPVAQDSVAPEIDALTAASTIVDVNPAVEPAPAQVVQDTTAQATESIVDVLTPVPDTEVVTTPAPIVDVSDAPAAEIPVAEEAPQEETLTEVPTIPEVVSEDQQEAPVPVPESVPQETPVEVAQVPAAPAEAAPENAVPEIPVIGTVTPVQNIPQAPQQSVVVNQSTAMPQTSAMKNLGITLDFGSQPSLDSNATLDEIVAGAQELFIEGTKNLVLVMTEKLYKDLREKEEELKKREIVLAQRERAINDSTLAMMNGEMMGQPMMGGMMGQPMMGQPMMGGMMQQPMMGQPMMGGMMQQPMMGQQPVGTQVPPQTDQANGQV